MKDVTAALPAAANTTSHATHIDLECSHLIIWDQVIATQQCNNEGMRDIISSYINDNFN